ncbi:hypothetical protein [Aureispira sp. CCB-QB1]|uniref:hypothetical protein n=1 Tax=Aureispira sp. CCB-QB1 TaxID=1313421 RepID=UPI0006989D49|nr:hypothetical protein [Aureispira sp. CCB-QB1]
MKPIIKKICSIALPLVVLSFGACKITPPPTPCDAITISDFSHFKTDQTLTDHCAGVDYIIKGSSYYDVTANLKVESGVTIQFEDGTGLAIQETGSINAIGTSAEPITLMGSSENAVGAWLGVIVYSDKTANILDHVTIKGAGSDAFNSNGERGCLVIYADSKIKIDNCTFENSAAYGINSNYTSAQITSLMNNKFNNNNTPMLMRANYVNVVDATNSFSGNTNSYVHMRVGNEIKTTQTWQALSIPYRLTASSGGIFGDQEIGNSGKLTINAGAIIEFEVQTGLHIDDGGALIAVGTPNNKIQFKGEDDRSGIWNGIQFTFTQSPFNEIGYATIEHTGSDKGAIYMWADPVINIHDVSINDVSNCAFYDAPKGANDAANPNLTRTNISYNNVVSQYCKGN